MEIMTVVVELVGGVVTQAKLAIENPALQQWATQVMYQIADHASA